MYLPAEKTDLRKAIVDHIKHQGERNWKVVRDAFPHIPTATFWRNLKDVRRSLNTVIDLEPSASRGREVRGSLAVPDSDLRPPITREAPLETDFPSYIDRLLAAADLLESQSVIMVNGQVQVARYSMFKEAQRLRASAMDLAGKYSDEFLLVTDSNAFFREICDEIGKAAPMVQMRIAKAMQRVGERKQAARKKPAANASPEVDRPTDPEYEWSGFTREVSRPMIERYLLLIKHSTFSHRQVAELLEYPVGFLQTIENKAAIPDTSRLLRFAMLKLRESMRAHLDWIYTARGDPLLVFGNDPAVLESHRKYCDAIVEEARKFGLLKVPESLVKVVVESEEKLKARTPAQPTSRPVSRAH